MTPKTLSETQEIIQDNLDYTLFSWSKQKGIDPIAVKYGEGVYLYDYDGKRYILHKPGEKDTLLSPAVKQYNLT